MPKRLLALGALVIAAAILAAVLPRGDQATVDACAFDPRRPHAYEADRSMYHLAIDAASVNQLFPGDPFFALQAVRRGTRSNWQSGAPFIPATLLKAIGWVESNTTMATSSTPFNSIGQALVSFDCGHGIMQVTTGMTVPLGANGQASDRQVSIATHYAYNIARGAQILAEKWNAAPEQRPIAGSDTNADPAIVENWYYATWGYNGFTGPGSRQSNHPLDPQLGSWPRASFRCDGAQSYNRFPYQELVWGCMANPPNRSGERLWQPLPASLPDMTNPAHFNAMGVSNWLFPYASMDIPTPQPEHRVQAPAVPSDIRTRIFGQPAFTADSQALRINVDDAGSTSTATVRIRNSGTGIASWYAVPSHSFITVNPPAGAAVGNGVICTAGTCPDGELTISINPTLLPSASASGTVTISSPNGGGRTTTIRVNVSADFEIGAPGTSRAR